MECSLQERCFLWSVLISCGCGLKQCLVGMATRFGLPSGEHWRCSRLRGGFIEQSGLGICEYFEDCNIDENYYLDKITIISIQ
jgi:hypothetical protein